MCLKKECISELITQCRNRKKVTQAELASLAGISFRTLQRIEAGEVSPRIEVIFRIFSALKVNASQELLALFQDVPKATPEYSNANIQFLPNPTHGQGAEAKQSCPILNSEWVVEYLKHSLTNDFEHQSTELGYWEWNLTAQKLYWSPQMFTIYSADMGEGAPWDQLKNYIHADDFIKIQEDLAKLANFDIPYENIHRVLMASESYRVYAYAKKFTDLNHHTIIFGIAKRLP